MRFLVPILTIAAFVWLAVYSRQREPGYTPSQVSAMNALVAQATHPTFSHKQAVALADLWGISSEEAAKPVVLWKN